MLSAFAQFERDMIITRTQEGKALVRQNNLEYREGRKQIYSDRQIKAALSQLEQGKTYQEVSAHSGISISTLRRRAKQI